jgi:4-amino-4-deoxy-L-arabinose transferase-like glycosyltransferase
MTSQKNKQPGSTLWLKILIVVIFILGTGIRLYDVTDEPLEFHPARQLRSAIIARSIYYKNNPDIPREKILFAVSEANQRGLIEPPIMENLSVIAYRLMGEEEIWVGRLFSIAFWLLGGWALYALSKEFGSLTGSIVSLSLYFLLPFSILATRVLMPDPMMVAFTVISIYCLYTWEKKRTYPWAVLTGLVSGFTIFSKSVAGLILIVPFAVFILKAEGLKSALKNLQVWVILLLSALPIAGFTYYGFAIDGRMAGQFTGRFYPNLYTSPSLYANWLANIADNFSLIALILGMVGLALVADKKLRWLLAGWWGGYFLYGLVFPHHISTHSYYHLPLVPILALSLAPLASRIADLLNHTPQKTFNWAVVILAYVAFISFNIWSVWDELGSVDYRLSRERLEHIGEVIAATSQTSTLALTDDYEASLRFYGFLSSRHWPSRGEMETIQASFEELWDRKTLGVHFFVVLDLAEFDKQSELKERLLERYPIYEQGEGYILFDMRLNN